MDLNQRLESIERKVDLALQALNYSAQKATKIEPTKSDATESSVTPPLKRSDSTGVAYDDLKRAITSLAATRSRQAALDVLKRFNVVTAKDLPESEYTECYFACKEAMLDA
jgi:hypothetical protein